MPGSETKEEKMFLIETIKRIVREMPKVESDERWTEPTSIYYELYEDDPYEDLLNPACPAYALHEDD